MAIITISRMYGSGGSDVAARVAQLLGWSLLDNAFVDAVAERLGGDRADAARGIVRIADHNMINALKLVSVNRGHDPRDFTLVAFGGGGGMHAVALARELGIRKVVIPRAADVFSAWGMLMSDLRRDYFATRLTTLTPDAAAAVEGWLRETEELAARQFADEGISDVRFARFGRLRYENQEHSSEIALPDGEVTESSVSAIAERFHAAYEREYTYRLDAPVEFVAAHMVAFAEVGKLTPAALPTTGRAYDDALKGRREVDYATEGVHVADIVDGALLEPGMTFQGPAIVETAGSTIVAHPGSAVRVDPYGNLIVTIEEEEE
jgi:N-methylhydantoinase A